MRLRMKVLTGFLVFVFALGVAGFAGQAQAAAEQATTLSACEGGGHADRTRGGEGVETL